MALESELRRPPEEQIAELSARTSFLEERLRSIEERLWCPDCQLPRGAMLSDRDIQRLVRQGRIKLDPLPNIELSKDSDLGACKIDLHLGDNAKFHNTLRVSHVDFDGQKVGEKDIVVFDIAKEGKIVIAPGEVIVADTLEWVTLPDDIAGRLEGKSSLARQGLAVQLAPVFDPGWNGVPALELHNIGRVAVTLYHKMRICAMSFTHLSSPTLKGYAQREGVRYGVQTGARF